MFFVLLQDGAQTPNRSGAFEVKVDGHLVHSKNVIILILFLFTFISFFF